MSIGLTGEISQRGLLHPVTSLAGLTLAAAVAPNLFIPILHKMRVTSVFEVYEMSSTQHPVSLKKQRFFKKKVFGAPLQLPLPPPPGLALLLRLCPGVRVPGGVRAGQVKIMFPK